MLSLESFNAQLSVIMNDFAKAVITRMNKDQSNVGEQQEELDALVDVLCVEAINKILRIVELVTTANKQQHPPSIKSKETEDLITDTNDHHKDRSTLSTELDHHRERSTVSTEMDHHHRERSTVSTELDHHRERSTVSRLSTEMASKGHSTLSEQQPETDQRRGLFDAMMQPVVKLYRMGFYRMEIYKLCGPAEEDPENAPDDGGTSPSPPRAPLPSDHEYARPSSLVSADKKASSAAQNNKRKREKMKKALKPEPIYHPCEHCTKIFPSTCRLDKHRRKEHSPQPEPICHRCERCKKIFPNEDRLGEHHRKEHSPQECTACGELFHGIHMLRTHEITAHGIMPYKCDYCDKGFAQKTYRNDHVKRMHTGEKTALCDICGKAYMCAASLRLHRVIHFDKSFTCDVCGKSFYHAPSLELHKRVHAGMKPYLCPTCGKCFTLEANMRRHQATIHDKVKRKHPCSVCGKILTTQWNLKAHMKRRHSGLPFKPPKLPKLSELPDESLFICEVCGKRFRHSSQYKSHKLTHSGEKPFRCHTCGKGYRTKQQVKDHMNIHTGETPYKCTVCDKTFSTLGNCMKHKSIHSGETPYRCKECGRRFRLLVFLKQHEQTLAHKRRMSSHIASLENTDSNRTPSAAKRKKHSNVWKNS